MWSKYIVLTISSHDHYSNNNQACSEKHGIANYNKHAGRLRSARVLVRDICASLGKTSGGKESTKHLSTSETLDAKTETYGARRQKEFTAMRRKGQSDGVISVIFCINILFNRADPQ